MSVLYEIRRFYRDGRPYKVIATDLTLEQAQAHCNDPRTADPDGEWFDGYEVENPTAEEQAARAANDARLRDGVIAAEELIAGKPLPALRKRLS